MKELAWNDEREIIERGWLDSDACRHGDLWFWAKAGPVGRLFGDPDANDMDHIDPYLGEIGLMAWSRRAVKNLLEEDDMNGKYILD